MRCRKLQKTENMTKLLLNIKNGVFHIHKFCSLHMKTLHITESKCEQVQGVTLTRQFFRIEILDIFK